MAITRHFCHAVLRSTFVGAQLDRAPGRRQCHQTALAEMLFCSPFSIGGGFDSAAAGLEVLHGEAVSEEMRQVVDITFDVLRIAAHPVRGCGAGVGRGAVGTARHLLA